MTNPATDLYRFAIALALGGGLGVLYSFLRPLRPKHPFLSDFLFLPGMFYAWLYHSFAICQGDLRLGYSVGLLLGCLILQRLLGRLLDPPFRWFLHLIGRILSFFAIQSMKIYEKTRKTLQISLGKKEKNSYNNE